MTACHRCNYALTGLPSAYQCPECGLGFDEHTAGWLFHTPGGRKTVLMIVACSGLMLLIVLLQFGSYGVRAWRPWISLIVFLEMLFAAYITLRRIRHPWVSVALHPDGVYVAGIWRKRIISWSHVRSIEFEKGVFSTVARLLIRTHRGKTFSIGRLIKVEDRVSFLNAAGPAFERYKEADWPDLVIQGR